MSLRVLVDPPKILRVEPNIRVDKKDQTIGRLVEMIQIYIKLVKIGQMYLAKGHRLDETMQIHKLLAESQ